MSLEWLQTARCGGQVERTHTVPTLQSYNVAEHSFNAILISRTICKDLDWKIEQGLTDGIRFADIDENRITNYLLLHDLPEVYTGDIPANVKKETVLKKTMDEIEEGWYKEHVPDYMKQTPIDNNEYIIAKLADSLELCMFCKDELSMGNRHERFLYMVTNIIKYTEYYKGMIPHTIPIIHKILNDLRGAL